MGRRAVLPACSSHAGASRRERALVAALAVGFAVLVALPILPTGTGPAPRSGGVADLAGPAGSPPGSASAVRPSTAPPALPAQSAIVYDAADGYVLLFGPGPTPTRGVTWSYQNGSWTELDPTVAPSSRVGEQMAYDAQDGYVVLFGGESLGPGPLYLGDTWTFSDGQWANITAAVGPAPPGRDGASFADDPAEGDVVLFGGWDYGNLSDTWTYHADAWTERTPTAHPGRGFGGAMAFDPSSGALLDFGEWSYSSCPSTFGACNLTWAYANGNWTELAPALAPPGRFWDALTLDSESGALVLYGGAINGGLAPNTTWEYLDGNWALLPTQGTVPSMWGPGLAFDPVDNVTVLVGGENGSANLSASWTLAGSTWSQVAPALYLSSPEVDVNRSTTITARTSAGAGGWSYAFAGLPPGCPAPSGATVTCQPSAVGSYAISVVVRDANGAMAEASATLLVQPTLGFAVASIDPNPVSVNTTLRLDFSVEGGSSPYSFAYAGLPPGCFSQPASALTCAPRSPGVYSVTAEVTDRFGESAFANVSVTVVSGTSAPPPTSGAAPWLGVEIVVGALALVGAGIGVAAVLQRWARRDPK